MPGIIAISYQNSRILQYPINQGWLNTITSQGLLREEAPTTSIRNFYAELFELSTGVEEMRGDPEYGPFFHIISAQACQVV